MRLIPTLPAKGGQQGERGGGTLATIVPGVRECFWLQWGKVSRRSQALKTQDLAARRAGGVHSTGHNEHKAWAGHTMGLCAKLQAVSFGLGVGWPRGEQYMEIGLKQVNMGFNHTVEFLPQRPRRQKIKNWRYSAIAAISFLSWFFFAKLLAR